jgi:hypothetical protein
LVASDELTSTISLSLKLKEKVEIAPTLNNIMNDDIGVAFELSWLVYNIEKEVCGVLHSFLSTSKEYEEKTSL